jgi:hypothetical protein
MERATFFHNLLIWVNTCTNELFMELVCGQLLQNKLQFKQKNSTMVQDKKTLLLKGVSRKFKRGVDWKKLKNEKLKKNETCYNCGIRNHFANECHKKKTKFEEKIQRLFTCGHDEQD